ncbi:DUF4879 domain-containing protein [Lacrimispora sp. BS-2]|uniref:DUF4879 domain-containing protein n=1 Tax=Lacrimispora sp. BS-2 TaxID=3151850 RepID=A0AAU7PW11_9FIRM
MKRVISTLLITISVLMAFSMTAFAAPLQPVSSVNIIEKGVWDKNFGSPALDSMNGRVYFAVRTMGHGSAVATYDNVKTKEFWHDVITNYAGTPIGFDRYYDCGPVTTGKHTFRIKTTSYGSPYNTIERSGTFTY